MRSQPSTTERRRAIIGAVAGNTLEWYDFAVYGILASYISQAFFPGENRAVALLATFGLFGVGFVLRPVGAAVIGHIGDTWGRKPALLLTIASMAAGSLVIGFICLPIHGFRPIWALRKPFGRILLALSPSSA